MAFAVPIFSEGFGPWYKEFYWIFQLNLYYSLYLRQLSLMNTDCAALAFPAAIWWFFRANQEHIIVFYSGFANHICHQRFHKSTPDERHLLFFFQKYLTVFAKIKTNSVTRKCLLHFVAFFHVASLFSTGVDNQKVGVDNEKALELTNSTVFHRGRQWKSSRAGKQNIFFIFQPDFNIEISPKNVTKHPVA